KFDDVMNEQRKVIYEQRRELMASENIVDTIVDMRHEAIEEIISSSIPEKAYHEQWDIPHLHEECLRILGLDLPVEDWAKEEGIAEVEIKDRIIDASDRKMAEKAVRFQPEVMRSVEKSLLLQILDQMWKEHLLTLDHLRQGIGLRAYGQRDPLREYQREAFDLFEEMLNNLRQRITSLLSHIEMEAPPSDDALKPREQVTHEGRSDPALQGPDGESEGGEPTQRPVQTRQHGTRDPNDPTTWGRVARNAPCPCGSGNKYKHCHGKA
ncbi:MAG: preprotein translocase subunit SecA, partial [Rhodospirillales bacterium]|nr:preprotein translocase subunit SecA [Rhodospirillales bacterium]